MNLKLVAASVVSLATVSLYAAPVASSTPTASPDAPVEMVSPGHYMASIMPGINREMGNKLEDALNKVQGVEKVRAIASDSSIHFTIKDGAKVPITSIQNAVTKTDSDAVMSAPILEHSLNAAPGL